MKQFLICLITVSCACSVGAQIVAPNDAGVSFGHVHLSVADLELHKRLWAELFDGKLIEREGYAAVQVPGTLIFFTEGEPTAPSHETAIDHVGFRVRHLDAVLARWQSSGYGVDSRSGPTAGTEEARITMPNGTAVELQEDRELPVTAEMSHVHFVVEQHRKRLRWYADIFGAKPQLGGEEESVNVPGSALSFGSTHVQRASTDSTAIDHIGFEVEDFESFAEMLERRGIEFVFGPLYIESLDLWVAFFEDESGVLVEITEGLDKF